MQGNSSPKRRKQKLDYYLYENPKTPKQRTHNKEANRRAEIIRAQVEKELIDGKSGFQSTTKKKANFILYFEKLTNVRFESDGNYGNWKSVLKHLKNYKGVNISFEQIDEQFCRNFLEYLKNLKTKSNKPLAENSIHSYFNKFRAALNQAVDDGIISKSPAKNITLKKAKETIREYLTEEELYKIERVECRYDVLKNAFLFACFTGLRWADVEKLKWSEIEPKGEIWKVNFHQKKTRRLQYHYINKSAQKFMGEIPKDKSSKVFIGLKYSSYFNLELQKWVMRAGITKDITFHCSRHTFATYALSKGADLYTISELLGHKELRTTQIYAKIIDAKKMEAVELIDIFRDE